MNTKLKKTQVVLLLGTMLGLPAQTYASVYNFYFNNTEQGPNSTASPAISVTDGKVTKTLGPEADTTTGASAPASATVAASPVIGTTESHFTPRPESKLDPDFRHWRFEAAAMYMPESQALVTVDWTAHKYVNGNTGSGMVLGVAYFPIPHIGLGLHGGLYRNSSSASELKAFGGADVEVVPWRFSFLGIQDGIEPALLFGGSTIPQDSTNVANGVITDSPNSDQVVVPVAGARLTMKLKKWLGITAAARIDLDRFSYMTTEAGVTIHL